MRVVPVTLREANAFIEKHHRHHGATRGCKFSIAVVDEAGTIHGVAVAGRPVARWLDDGMSLEVTRACTDGEPNACSMLYGACRRAAFAMGYTAVYTYTLADEKGTSLLAAGWTREGRIVGHSWNSKARIRTDKHPTDDKIRWVARR